MKIRIVGDSFALMPRYPEKIQFAEDYTWQMWLKTFYESVDAELDVYGVPGVSLHYLSWYFMKTLRAEMKPEDILIFIMPNLHRKWWVYEVPSPNLKMNTTRVDSPDMKAIRNVFYEHDKLIEKYYDEKKQIEMGMVIAKMLEECIFYASAEGWRYVIISGDGDFEPYNPYCEVNGSMILPSYADVINRDQNLNDTNVQLEARDKMRDWFSGPQAPMDALDRRQNHLTKENHKIFAEKLYDSFENRVPLDLREGWVQGTLNTQEKFLSFNSDKLCRTYGVIA